MRCMPWQHSAAYEMECIAKLAGLAGRWNVPLRANSENSEKWQGSLSSRCEVTEYKITNRAKTNHLLTLCRAISSSRMQDLSVLYKYKYIGLHRSISTLAAGIRAILLYMKIICDIVKRFEKGWEKTLCREEGNLPIQSNLLRDGEVGYIQMWHIPT
jgi:hypothetical protein